MGIDKRLNELTENCGQIYGYEIIRVYPRGFKWISVRCSRYIEMEKNIFLCMFTKSAILYCDNGIIIIDYYSIRFERAFKEWCDKRGIDEWSGLSMSTPFYVYLGIFIIFTLLLFQFFEILSPHTILENTLDIYIFYAALIIYVFIGIFIPGNVYCYIYNKKYIKNKK